MPIYISLDGGKQTELLSFALGAEHVPVTAGAAAGGTPEGGTFTVTMPVASTGEPLMPGTATSFPSIAVTVVSAAGVDEKKYLFDHAMLDTESVSESGDVLVQIATFGYQSMTAS